MSFDDDSRAGDPRKLAHLLMRVKRPRYAHMAKHHQLHRELAEADYYYNLLAEAQRQVLGESGLVPCCDRGLAEAQRAAESAERTRTLFVGH